jgi:cytochrome c5
LIVLLLYVDRRVAPPVEWKPPVVSQAQAGGQLTAALRPDSENGKWLFGQTCTSCHGSNAQGLPHQGVNLRESKFVAAQSDPQLVAFLKTGRQPTDPKSQRGLLMPARGGNPSLIDVELVDIVAYLRQVQHDTRRATSQPTLTSARGLRGGEVAQ